MSTSTKFTIHEDWTVVILGFIIIGISLFIFLPQVPVFKWTNGNDLLNHSALKVQRFVLRGTESPSSYFIQE
jgi:hypothetical protein